MVPCLFLGCHETYARYHADADHSRSGSHERCMIPALDAMTELTLVPVRRWGRFFGLAPCRMAGNCQARRMRRGSLPCTDGSHPY